MASINFIRVLTPEGELARRKEEFAKIRLGVLFNLGQRRFFIAVEQIEPASWAVVALDEENRLRIVRGEPVQAAVLSFDEMRGLNVHLED